MTLLIAIPALNEEDSISQTIERCLAARNRILQDSPVTEIEITVVSDGSTDRTVELAATYRPQINLIVFERNRGYGAAIKEAWRQSSAELLGFLDADGTCDPNLFGPLCRTLIEENACVVLGSRLHAGSKMPLIRRLGNVVFAALLTVFSSTRVRDSASGMRVIRRDCLDRLMPLSDKLDFTPAMSARCILAGNLPIREIDMPYAERAGQSKLHVMGDGLRFLGVILKTALLYRPSRILGLVAVLLFVVSVALMTGPALYYLENRAVQEWMIYRFVVSQLLGLSAVVCVCLGYLARRVVRMTLGEGTPDRSCFDLISVGFDSRAFWFLPAILTLAGGWLVYPSYRQLVTTGATYEHWSRFIVMSFAVGSALILLVTRGVGYVMDLLGERVDYLNGSLQEKLARQAP